MKKLNELLKEYFENTPREEVERAWKETEEFDKVGETAESFIKRMESLNKQCKCVNCKANGIGGNTNKETA